MLRNSPGPPPLRPDVFRCLPAGEKNRSSRLFPSATTTVPELSRTAPSTDPNNSGPSASLEPMDRMGRSETLQVFGGFCACTQTKDERRTTRGNGFIGHHPEKRPRLGKDSDEESQASMTLGKVHCLPSNSSGVIIAIGMTRWAVVRARVTIGLVTVPMYVNRIACISHGRGRCI